MVMDYYAYWNGGQTETYLKPWFRFAQEVPMKACLKQRYLPVFL